MTVQSATNTPDANSIVYPRPNQKW